MKLYEASGITKLPQLETDAQKIENIKKAYINNENVDAILYYNIGGEQHALNATHRITALQEIVEAVEADELDIDLDQDVTAIDVTGLIERYFELGADALDYDDLDEAFDYESCKKCLNRELELDGLELIK